MFDKATEKRKLFEILDAEKGEDFIDYVLKHKLDDLKGFQKLMNSLSPDEHIQFWNKIYDILDKSLKAAHNYEEDVLKIPSTLAVRILGIIVDFILFALDCLESAPVALMEMILFCGQMLNHLDDDKEEVRIKILSLCKKCYAKDVPFKNEIIASAITFWLQKSLVTACNKKTKSYIKEIYGVKDSLNSMLAVEGVNKASFKKRLLDCAKSKAYYSFAEGRKVLASIFCVDVSCVDRIHESMKDLIFNSSSKECQMYGEVYTMAWIEAGRRCLEDVREEWEFRIQDFMDYAVNMPRQNPMLPKLRKFLSAFHMKRTDSMIMKLMCKLYSPILWRGLENSLGYVRANSLQLFIDVFPLEDPSLLIVEAENELNRQMFILSRMFDDDCPLVRSIAAIGICNILSYHRALIPTSMVMQYLLKLADASTDMSWQDVRVSVIKGMKLLIQNHFPVQVLKTVLGKLSCLFSDTSDKVRLYFCELLLLIKKHPAIKYWEIVPANEILQSIAEDKLPIQKLLVQLVHNSYIPVEQPEIAWLHRCVDLINQNMEASSSFFMQVSEIVGLTVTTKFIQFIFRALSLFVRVKIQQRNTENFSYQSASTTQKDDDKKLIQLLEAEGNNDCVTGLVEAAYCMFRSVLTELEKPKNKKLYKTLLSKIAKKLPALLKYFQEENEVWETLFALSSYMPSSLLPDFSDMCFKKLEVLPDDAHPGECKILLECLCNVGKGFKVLECIQSAFEVALKSSRKESVLRTRSEKTNSTLQPPQASKYLKTLLTYRNPRVIVLSQNVEQVKDFLLNTDDLQKAIENSKTTLADGPYKVFLYRAFSSLLMIAIHMHRPNKHAFKVLDTDSHIRKLMIWISATFFSKPATSPPNQKAKKLRTCAASRQWKELGVEICKDLMDHLFIVITNKIPEAPAVHYIDFINNAMESEFGPRLMADCINVVFGLSQFCHLLSASADLQQENQKLILPIFSHIIELLCQHSFHSHLPTKGKAEAKKLKALLLSQSQCSLESTNPLENLIPVILKAIFAEIASDIDCEDYKNIEFSDSCITLMSAVSSHPILLKAFLTSIKACVHEEDSHVIAAMVVLARTLSENKVNTRKLQEEVKETCSMLKSEISSIKNLDEKQTTLTTSSLSHISATMKSIMAKKRIQSENEEADTEEMQVDSVQSRSPSDQNH